MKAMKIYVPTWNTYKWKKMEKKITQLPLILRQPIKTLLRINKHQICFLSFFIFLVNVLTITRNLNVVDCLHET